MTTEKNETGKELLPCPFCGGEAFVEREGDRRQSCIVGCEDCRCRLESNENGAGRMWNTRAPQAQRELVASAVAPSATDVALVVTEEMIERARNACCKQYGKNLAYFSPETDEEWKTALIAAFAGNIV